MQRMVEGSGEGWMREKDLERRILASKMEVDSMRKDCIRLLTTADSLQSDADYISFR